jgi:alcohol dehydrogenase (cytochrome c)
MGFDVLSRRVSRRDLLKVSGVAAAATAVGVGPRFTSGASHLTASAASQSAGTTSGDWPTFGYDYAQTRHVPFKQITKDNVSKVGRVWSYNFLEGNENIPPGQESFPIVVDGVLYVTTSFDHVFALDAKSGNLLWHWAPEQIGFFKNFGLTYNRGVAYGEGKVYLLTLDMRVVAIDAKTGKLVKQITIGDTVDGADPSLGYYETTAPIYYKGTLFVGSSGSDNGVRGFMMAYKASDLTPAWANPFWTVPPAGQGWRKQGNFHGGGTPWMPGTIDTETDILYFATGNPSPDFFGEVRPGSNPNVDSCIAVNAKTGEQVWVAQSITRDLWDYDMAAPIVLMTAEVGGEHRKVVAEGSKAGQWWCWDAASGKVIYDGVPFSTIKHPKPTEQGVIAAPGPLGGANYAPQSYDPTTNYYLICNVESPALLKQATAQQIERRAQGDVDFGGTFENAPNVEPYGTYVAIDMNTGKVVYNKKVPGVLRGGFTTTATGLGLFAGTKGDENIHAIDTSSGDMLWTFGVGGEVATAPTVYMIDGQEYIALTVGGTSTSGNIPTQSLIEVFALGGNTQELAPATPVATPAAQPIPGPDQWLVLDPKHNNGVIFNAVAAWTEDNNGMNFNGYGNGQMTVTVPQGWLLTIKFWNKSARLPHSIVVTTEDEFRKKVGQSGGFDPAFVGAYSPANPINGYIGNSPQPLQSNSGNIKMSTAGTYIMACDVPGHAAQGMWDVLKVDPNATKPSLSTSQGGTPVAGTPMASPVEGAGGM